MFIFVNCLPHTARPFPLFLTGQADIHSTNFPDLKFVGTPLPQLEAVSPLPPELLDWRVSLLFWSCMWGRTITYRYKLYLPAWPFRCIHRSISSSCSLALILSGNTRSTGLPITPHFPNFNPHWTMFMFPPASIPDFHPLQLLEPWHCALLDNGQSAAGSLCL